MRQDLRWHLLDETVAETQAALAAGATVIHEAAFSYRLPTGQLSSHRLQYLTTC